MSEPEFDKDEASTSEPNSPPDEERSTIRPLPIGRGGASRRSMMIALALLAAGAAATLVIQIVSRIVDR